MLEDDFAKEVEVNPDYEVDSSSESEESSKESPTQPSRGAKRHLPSTAEGRGSNTKQKKAKGKMLSKSERERITDALLKLECESL